MLKNKRYTNKTQINLSEKNYNPDDCRAEHGAR